MERIRVDFSGPHLEHLRAVMDTTPGSKDALSKDVTVRSDEHEREEAPMPVPMAPDDDLEPYIPIWLSVHEQEHAAAGKSGGGRDAA